MKTLTPLCLQVVPELVRGRAMTDWERREMARLRVALVDPAEVREVKGVKYWVASDRPVPPSVYKEAFASCPAAQTEAYEQDTSRFLAAYRKANANRRLSGEEQSEMRAAFGPGAIVVDVITGQRFRT